MYKILFFSKSKNSLCAANIQRISGITKSFMISFHLTAPSARVIARRLCCLPKQECRGA